MYLDTLKLKHPSMYSTTTGRKKCRHIPTHQKNYEGESHVLMAKINVFDNMKLPAT